MTGFRRFMLVAAFAVLLSAQSGPVADEPGATVDVARAGRHLSQALQIRTIVQGDRGASEESVQAFRDFLERSYPAAHRSMSREITEHGGTLYTWRGRDSGAAPILLIAHLDVVPAEGQGDVAWDHPAFAGTIADGAVWGRGAIDMKGQLIGIFEAIEMLADQGYLPERTILVGLGADEEASGLSARGIASLLESRGLRAEFVLDEGPVVVDPFEMTGRRAAFIGVAEKGYGTLLVTASARGGHSSVPPRAPALLSLARAIVAIGQMRVDRPLDSQARAMLAALAPDLRGMERLAVDNLWLFGPIVRGRVLRQDAGRALLGTTFAPTMAAGSTAENQLPSIATAHINVRLHPRDTPDAVLADVRAAVASIEGVSVAWAAPPRGASPYADTRSASYRLLGRHIRRLAGERTPIVPILVFGGTDARFYARVAANAYRFQPYVLTQEELMQIHGPNEHLSLANLERAVRFFHGFIRDAASAGAGDAAGSAGAGDAGRAGR